MINTGSRPIVAWTVDTGSRPIMNSLKIASPRPSKTFVATLVSHACEYLETSERREDATNEDDADNAH